MTIFQYYFNKVEGHGWVETNSGKNLTEYIPETFARCTLSEHFQSMNLGDDTRDYFVRHCSANNQIYLKICVKRSHD